jgi:hypothetical protein
MPPEKAGPVIKIIDADKQDVGALNCAGDTDEKQV